MTENSILKHDLSRYGHGFNIFLSILESLYILFLILFTLDSRYSDLIPSPVFWYLLPVGFAAASARSWAETKFSNDKYVYSNYLDHIIKIFKENYLLFRSLLYLVFPILIAGLSVYLVKAVRYQLSLGDYLTYAFIIVSFGSFINFISDKNTTKRHVIIYFILCVAVMVSSYIVSFPTANQGIFSNAPMLFSWAIPFIGSFKKPHTDN